MENYQYFAHVTEETLLKYCKDIFMAAGMREEDAACVADNLVFADCCGMESHGVIRVPAYTKRLQDHGTSADAEICIEKDSPTTALVNGNNAMGQVVSTKAMKLCIEKARENGVAFVGVKGSNHFGMASYYSEMALPEDMIGMVFTSPAAHLMAPTGGIEPILDNNPFSFAIPSGKELPVVLDMATSVVARGKIGVALNKGEKIPKDWAMTIDGRPTDDPKEAFDGILLPVGGYKGYGLTVIVGILSAVLTGASILSEDVKDFYADTAEEQNIGHLFGCIRIDRFMDPELFKKHMDEMIEEIKGCKKAPGVEEILLPGEREFKNREKHRAEGIPLTENTYRNLVEVGKRYGLPEIEVISL
ncbi:MAG: Ldh family oxidoreductase [Lachnospiraceae bacterium]|nr:Ldh family oxidoreductase [Lachnospiraceae bacterium]